jgi:hypothetical protein
MIAKRLQRLYRRQPQASEKPCRLKAASRAFVSFSTSCAMVDYRHSSMNGFARAIAFRAFSAALAVVNGVTRSAILGDRKSLVEEPHLGNVSADFIHTARETDSANQHRVVSIPGRLGVVKQQWVGASRLRAIVFELGHAF